MRFLAYFVFGFQFDLYFILNGRLYIDVSPPKHSFGFDFIIFDLKRQIFTGFSNRHFIAKRTNV